MITKLSIANFKSIKQLDIDCKKINLFIGEPNTGKSNILEALALLSYCGRSGDVPLNDFVRFQTMLDLFSDRLADQTVEIKALTSDVSHPELLLALKADQSRVQFLTSSKQARAEVRPFRIVTYEGKAEEAIMISTVMARIKFFRFKKLERYESDGSEGLKPPSGTNLFSVVFRSEMLQETMAEFFQRYGLILAMEPNDRVFTLQKEKQARPRVIVNYPYVLQSDTLQRIIFYTVAIASNKDSVLVFEEPESNAFPYYTKYLGERIALDQTNQFFIATHNPYLLSAVLEKARKDEIQVFVTYFRDYQTKVKALTSDQMVELMEADPFLNLDLFTGEGE
jgi:AAA15 family ATPase/GTPase